MIANRHPSLAVEGGDSEVRLCDSMRVVVAALSTSVLISRIGKLCSSRSKSESMRLERGESGGWNDGRDPMRPLAPNCRGGCSPSGSRCSTADPCCGDCLQSVIDSTLPHDRFEILIADDGSTEPETLAILGQFEREPRHGTWFLPSDLSGIQLRRCCAAPKRILDEAIGEYVFFVDSDDTIGNQALERIAEGVATTPVDWIAAPPGPGERPCSRRYDPRAADRGAPASRAMSTLTVHKVFRRAEIERQRLRFDEGLRRDRT